MASRLTGEPRAAAPPPGDAASEARVPPRSAAARSWPAATEPSALAAVASVAGVVLAVVLGTYLRYYLVLGRDFPLNDGGLFYLMIEELRRARYALPASTAYNGAGIPFAYPPLALYAAGVLSDATGAPAIDVVRLLPALGSALTIPAFFLLARALLRSAAAAAVATFAFAVLPRTFLWFVMGGGLTRAPGLLFAILMLWQAQRMYVRRRARDVVATAVLGALAVLSHLENSWFAVYSAALLFLFFGRDRRGVVMSLGVVLGVVALTSPWWVAVVRAHGVAPFASAATGGAYAGNFSTVPIRTLNFSDEPQLTVLGVLGVLGAFVCLARRELLLPVWLAAVFVVNPRNPETPAAIPLALLVGVAVTRLIVPALHRAAGGTGAPEGRPARMWTLVAPALMLAYLAGYTFLAARSALKWDASLHSLDPAERDAMHWVSTHTPGDSRVLVLAFEPPWFGLDATSEWFPVLARRASVVTPQGYEWLPGRQFHRRIDRYNDVHACRDRGAACLERWGASESVAFTHVYLRKERCCAALLASLRASPDFAPVYDGPGAAVFAHAATPR
ncbi:MAG: hypothetical protein ACJ79S_00900 [Gemmatimonadaceae bacterium]